MLIGGARSGVSHGGQVAVEEAFEGGVQVGVAGAEDFACEAQRVRAAALPRVELLDGRQEPRERLRRQSRPRPAPHQDAFRCHSSRLLTEAQEPLLKGASLSS